MGDNTAPADRAAKIVLMIRGENTSALARSQIQEVAAEIRAAVEEAKPHTFKSCQEALRVCYRNAKAEAYEDAAKIVENHYWDSLEYEGIGKKHGASLAITLRARAADHKNCVKLNFIGKLDPLPFQWDDDAEVGK